MTSGGPIIPDYAGANVRGIVPALLGPASWRTGLPDWMPEPVAQADSVEQAIQHYVDEVKQGSFPAKEHVFN